MVRITNTDYKGDSSIVTLGGGLLMAEPPADYQGDPVLLSYTTIYGTGEPPRPIIAQTRYGGVLVIEFAEADAPEAPVTQLSGEFLQKA